MKNTCYFFFLQDSYPVIRRRQVKRELFAWTKPNYILLSSLLTTIWGLRKKFLYQIHKINFLDSLIQGNINL